MTLPLKRRHHFLSSKLLFGDTREVAVVSIGEEDQEVESDDDYSSVTSILSSLAYDEEDDNELDSLCKTEKNSETLEKKWLCLQKVFAQRDRMLERLSRTKNPRLIALIREREVIVRKQERELLLLNHLEEESQEQQHIEENLEKKEEEEEESEERFLFRKTDSENENVTEKENLVDDSSEDSDDDDDSVVWYDCHENVDISLASKALLEEKVVIRGFLLQMYDSVVIEWHISVPAVLSLVFHAVAHMTIYDIVEIFFELSGSHLSPRFRYVLFLISGLVLIRSSGYLYWWLGDNDFNYIKFDMHNRLRLRHWDARYMLWIKRHRFIQALVYMIGYHICYKVVFDCYEKFFYLFFHPDEVVVTPERRSRRGFLSFIEYLLEWASYLVGLHEDEEEDQETEYLFAGPIQATLFLLFLAAACVMILKFHEFCFFEKY